MSITKWKLLLGATESPIEDAFLLALCEGAAAAGYRIQKTPSANDVIAVRPQRHVGRYRVDFVVSFRFFGGEVNIVVECDGHAFHERTQFQAARDKRRDRSLTSLGYRIMRFTGSELNRDARGCAGEVMDMIMDFQTARIESAAKGWRQ